MEPGPELRRLHRAMLADEPEVVAHIAGAGVDVVVPGPPVPDSVEAADSPELDLIRLALRELNRRLDRLEKSATH